jgi:hypothetical protein
MISHRHQGSKAVLSFFWVNNMSQLCYCSMPYFDIQVYIGDMHVEVTPILYSTYRLYRQITRYMYVHFISQN